MESSSVGSFRLPGSTTEILFFEIAHLWKKKIIQTQNSLRGTISLQQVKSRWPWEINNCLTTKSGSDAGSGEERRWAPCLFSLKTSHKSLEKMKFSKSYYNRALSEIKGIGSPSRKGLILYATNQWISKWRQHVNPMWKQGLPLVMSGPC